MSSIYNLSVPFDRELIEAQLALELIPSTELPKFALEALEAGFDSPAVVRLAVLDKPTYFEVRDVLVEACKELGLRQLTKSEAALRIARRRAQQVLSSSEDPLACVREFYWLWIRAGYPRELTAVGNLDDELLIRNGPKDQDCELVRSRLSELLR
jgi:hypothetical protein